MECSLPNEFLISAGDGKFVEEWKIKEKKLNREISMGKTRCFDFTKFVDDHILLISYEGDDGCFLNYYDLENEKFVNDRPIFQSNDLSDVLWHINYEKKNNFMSISSWGGKVRILDLDGKERKTYKQYNNNVSRAQCSAFCRKRETLYSCGNNSIIKVYNLEKDKLEDFSIESNYLRMIDIKDDILVYGCDCIGFIDLRLMEMVEKKELSINTGNCRFSTYRPHLVYAAGKEELVVIDSRKCSEILKKKKLDGKHISIDNHRICFLGENYFAFCSECGSYQYQVFDDDLNFIFGSNGGNRNYFCLSYVCDDLETIGADSRLDVLAKKDVDERLEYLVNDENREETKIKDFRIKFFSKGSVTINKIMLFL